MTSRDFCYWLQGFFELSQLNSSGLGTGPQALTAKQAEIVQRHLSLVFAHEIDPKADAKTGKGILDAIHKASWPGLGDVQVRC